MSDVTGGSIEGTADAIVAQDVVDGRPGKGAPPPVLPPPVGRKKWWPWAAAGGGILGTLGGLGIGYAIGGGPATSTTVIPPTSTVVVAPQQPTSVTKPPIVSYSGPANVVFEFNCNGNPEPLNFSANVVFGGGKFGLTPQNGNPGFAGTLDPTNLGYNASGESGTMTGTLTSGQNQNGMFANKDPFYPCIGTFPMIILLPSAINTTPTVMEGTPLTSTITGTVPLIGTQAVGTTENGVNGALLAGGLALAVLGLFDLLLHPKKYDDKDDDDDDDGPPLILPRLRTGDYLP